MRRQPIALDPGLPCFTTFVWLLTATLSPQLALAQSRTKATTSAYSASLAVWAGTTTKAKTSPSNGRWASSTASGTLAFNYSVLATPIASPPGGWIGQGQSVTLTAEPGTIIRYTLDGSDPATTSETYSTPIAIPSNGATLRARAFGDNGTTSDASSDVYEIDSVPPAITAMVTPAPNANGWNRTPVKLTFRCSDNAAISTCPAPVFVSAEGAGQIVEVSATDTVGLQGNLSVTVNVDLTPPTASISTPTNNLVTSDSSVDVSGETSDALSGLSAVRCNGTAVDPTTGDVECSVGLRPGINALILSATDLAGNSVSDGIRVRQTGTAQRLSIAPRNPTMRVGQSLPIAAVTEFGPLVDGVTWSTSVNGVVSVSNDDDVTFVTAEATGVVTISATLGELIAESDITIVDIPPAVGTTIWKDMSGVLGQTRVFHSPTRADGALELYAINPSPAGSGAEVRALDSSGKVLWTESTVGEPLFTDISGGIIALIENSEFSGIYSAITRLAGAGGTPWTYEVVGTIQTRPVQTPDGLIVFAELSSGERQEQDLVGIEGTSGAVRFRTPAPETSLTTDPLGTCVNSIAAGTQIVPTITGPMSIGEDGATYFQTLVQDITYRYWSCDVNNPFFADGTVAVTQDLLLARLSNTGTLTLQSIWSDESPAQSHIDMTLKWVMPSSVAPNGLGSIVASYEVFDAHVSLIDNLTEYLAVNAFVWNDGTTHSVAPRYALENTPPDLQHSPLEFVGDDGTIYLRSQGGTTAFDLANGTTTWVTDETKMIAPQLGGGASFQADNGDMLSVSSIGATTSLGNLPIETPVQIRYGIYSGTANGDLVALAGPLVDEASFSFSPPDSSLVPSQDSGARQKGLALDNRHDDAETAAMTYLDFIFPMSQKINLEMGGFICREASGKFRWGRIQIGTENSLPAVDHSSDCALSQPVAHAHTHPQSSAINMPSGWYSAEDYYPSSDLRTADNHPEFIFYLRHWSGFARWQALPSADAKENTYSNGRSIFESENQPWIRYQPKW